jgi:15,16-dihydrobiliverdin:ferredoxin oxidoreductase
MGILFDVKTSQLKSPMSSSSIANVLRPSKPVVEKTLPWSKPLVPSTSLSYMPMFEEQLKMMQSMGMEQVSIEEKFICQHSSAKPARIGSMIFKNDKFRKVRMTYFDAGDNVQVFNTLWYPHFEYDMPLLGIDLISLGRKRVLTVIDMQPVFPTTEYSDNYISQLSPIRAKYPDLHGVLSGKIYDDTSFFSKNMLFGRFTDESKLKSVVQPAFSDYLHKYVAMMDQAVPDTSDSAKELVRARQAQYDIYSAKKDPAVGLFDAYFGKEWSTDYVHDFLFEMSERPDRES